MTADDVRVTADDVTELNRATLQGTSALARHAGTALIVVAGVGLVAWMWIAARQQRLVGADGFPGFGSDGEGVSLTQRLDLLANSIGFLVNAVLVGGLGLGLRLVAELTISRGGGSLTAAAVGEPWPDNGDDLDGEEHRDDVDQEEGPDRR